MRKLSRFQISLPKSKTSTVPSKNGIVKSEVSDTIELSGTLIESFPIKDIKQDPYQARTFISKIPYEDLKASIKRERLHQPPLLFKNEKGEYILKAGQRRLRAVKELGFTHCPVLVTDNFMLSVFGAISTNEFSDSIHPINKGIQVASIFDAFKKEGKVVTFKDIAKYYNKKESTIYEWNSYNSIDVEVRNLIVEHDIRQKTFLRNVIKICKKINKGDETLEIKKQLISFEVKTELDLYLSSGTKSIKQNDKPVKGSGLPEFSRILYFKKSTNEIIISDAYKKLSNDQKESLKAKAIELINVLEGGD